VAQAAKIDGQGIAQVRSKKEPVSTKAEQSGKTDNLKNEISSIQNDIYRLRAWLADDLSCRPDFVANKYLRTGWVSGKHPNEWPRLDEAKLSAEQKAELR
jgi:hypothetical protein